MNPLFRALTLGLLAAFTVFSQPSVPIKWACIGNSITAGAYPGLLATKLGPSFTMENDGVGGTTLLKSGDLSYWTNGRLANVFALRPDIITIALGTNDSKPVNWDDSANFVRDYTTLIDTLLRITPTPQIWLVLPAPAWKRETGTQSPTLIRGTVIKNSVIPRIRQVATAKGLKIIDLNTPLTNSLNLFLPDSIHPSAAGADSIASIIFRTFKANATRVACIGNSITQGNNWDMNAYPARLGMLLGRNYFVENEGVSGATLQKAGDLPYWTQQRFRNAFALQPNFITIKLGTNDTKPQNWNSPRFLTDLRAMADTLAAMPSRPTVWLCLPVPIWPNTFGINSTILQNQLIPLIRQVGTEKSLTVIDLNTPMMPFQAYFADGVHPNNAGQDSIAHWIYRVLRTAPVEVRPSRKSISGVPEMNVRGSNLQIVLPGTLDGRLTLLTGKGEKIGFETIHSGTSSLSLSRLSPGIYVMVLESAKGRSAKRMVLGAMESK